MPQRKLGLSLLSSNYSELPRHWFLTCLSHLGAAQLNAHRTSIVSVAAWALVASVNFPLVAFAAPELCGDVDASTRITAGDALLVLRRAVNLPGTLLCPGCRLRAVPIRCGDFDASGAVTSSDALSVLRAAIGLPTTLKCPECVDAQCGDGKREGVEQCDDAGESVTCDIDCTLAVCGDRHTNFTAGEHCDDGNQENTDGCLNDCRGARCGDGFIQSGVEECDDGQGNSDTQADRCRISCNLPSCGDGTTDTGEECDDGMSNDDNEPDRCRANCRNPDCGDRVVDSGEECDKGGSDEECDGDCTRPVCGDGYLNVAAGEECDDGVANSDQSPDSCRTTCQSPACGDGITDSQEECDDGNSGNDDQCLDLCRLAKCGDGYVWTGTEECDDGNLSDSDECLNDCSPGYCGDGVVQDLCSHLGPGFELPCALNSLAQGDLGNDTRPRVVANPESSSALACWESPVDGDFDLECARSEDRGRTWGESFALNSNSETDSGDDQNVEIAALGATDWIAVWDSTDRLDHSIGQDRDILFARSADDGITWSSPAALNSTAADPVGRADQHPHIAVDGLGTVVVVWVSANPSAGTGTDLDVFFARSSDGASTWSPAAPISQAFAAYGLGSDEEPRVATDGRGRWVVAWHSAETYGDTGEDLDIFVSESADLGVSWSTPAPINTYAQVDAADDRMVQLAPDRTGRWVTVWRSSDDRAGSGSDADIFFASSLNPMVWDSEGIVNSYALSDSGHDTRPTLDSDGYGNWIAAWQSTHSDPDALPTGADADLFYSTFQFGASAWSPSLPLNRTFQIDTGGDGRPSLTNDRRGRWLAAWQSDSEFLFDSALGSDFDILTAILTCEQCDDGGLTEDCSADCFALTHCGDGKLDLDSGEECDDGNNLNTDGCLEDCSLPLFGEVTEAAGLDHRGASWSSAWGDYNQDGWPDLWVGNHDSQPNLYLNNTDGTFTDIVLSVWDKDPLSDTHGAAWGDFDNDGDQDLLEVVGAGGGLLGFSNHLFVNDQGILSDLGSEYGVDFPQGRGRTPLWLDWNRDGQVDVVLANQRRPDLDESTAIFRQDGGVFLNATSEIGLTVDGPAFFAQSCDLIGDFHPELILHGFTFPHRFFGDLAGGGFGDVSHLFTMPKVFSVHDIAVADFNNDGRFDLFLLGDHQKTEIFQPEPGHIDASISVTQFGGPERGVEFKGVEPVSIDLLSRFVWQDEEIFIGGTGFHPSTRPFELDPSDPAVHGSFPHEEGTDRGIFIGYDPDAELWQIRIGIGLGSRPATQLNVLVRSSAAITDVLPIGIELPEVPRDDRLFLNMGDGGFLDATTGSGLEGGSPCGSVAAADFDNDMDVDLYLVCMGSVRNRLNRLYLNDGSGVFTIATGAGGAGGSSDGLGDVVAAADYNRDGAIDLFVTNGHFFTPFNDEGPHQLFANAGTENHWLELDLRGTDSTRDALGAKVTVHVGEEVQTRQQGCEMHKWAQDDRRMHFGIGASNIIDSLIIEWPNGITQILQDVGADQILELLEPSAN